MPTFKANHYVPVLTWKRAEQMALQNVPAASRQFITPLIEIVPVPIDLETGDQDRSLDTHVEPAIERLIAAWLGQEFFLDPAEVALDVSSAGTNGAAHVYGEAAANNLDFIPVVGLSRNPAELAAAFAHRQRGLCLRLGGADLASHLLPASIAAFLQTHQLREEEIDLVLDFESIHSVPSFAFVSTAQAQIARVPNVARWRTMTLLGCSFPPNLGGIVGTAFLERIEWQGWLTVHANRAAMPRMPAFGDYVIQSPDLTEGYDPRFMPLSPAIRYTLSTQWMIIRGQTSRVVRPAVQFPAMAAQLIASAQFYGTTHCLGCRNAQDCAQGTAGFGSPEVWRRLGTIHHLVVASAQVSTVAVP